MFRNGKVWHSTGIEERLAPRKLKSTSGNIYTLKGNMDKLLALDTGGDHGLTKDTNVTSFMNLYLEAMLRLRFNVTSETDIHNQANVIL